MKLVFLTSEQFDKFSIDHPLHSFYQTSMYANLMKNYNYGVLYFGFTDNNNLVGAALLLTQKIIGRYSYAYSPRGPLINYDDKNIIKETSALLSNYLNSKGFVFLKIDPLVINNKRDNDGNIIPSPFSSDLISYLQKIGYSYFGENKFFGTLKPRWKAILKFTGTSTTIFKNFNKQTRNRIRKAQSRGIEIYQGTEDDMELFYSFVEKKHYRNLNYYKKFKESFNDKFEIYFAKLNTETYLRNVKKLYELELQKNENLNNEIFAQQSTSSKEKLTNSKIASDNLVSDYKSELSRASDLFNKYPDGLAIATCSIIVEKNGIKLLIEGQTKYFGDLCPMYLLKWHVIDKYSKEGLVFFDLNAITGYFEDNNKYKGLNETKLGFGSEVTEYIGEFDLIIKPSVYKAYAQTKLWRRVMRNRSK